MCTTVILFRPGLPWPLLFAANRDEMASRPWSPPGRHWPERPDVVAGLDHTAGGSWLGVNDHGLLAAVMNREGSLGPSTGKRSRGELVLEALDHSDAASAAQALAALNPAAYRSFNLVVADPTDAYWIRNRASLDIELFPLAPGLHMLSSRELDDPTHPRIAAYLERFAAAPVPDPGCDEWNGWGALMAERTYPPELGPHAAMNIRDVDGFGTLSSSLIALPRFPGFGERVRWLHAAGPPDETPYRPVEVLR